MSKRKIVAIKSVEAAEPARPRLVAICPTVERQDLVRQLAKSYRETAGDDAPPLLFVVSGADDGTEGWCRNAGFDVLRSEAPLTYGHAVNLGAKSVDAEWLLLLNNDLILQPGFWTALDEMIALNYEVIGAKLLYPDGKIQHYGKWYTLDWYPFHVLRYQPADHPQAQQIRPFPNVTFACVAIRKDVWDDLGGLDEQFANGYEDDDFCCHARERGAQIGVHPGMLAIHLEGQTTGRDIANKEAMYKLFHRKWVESGRIQWVTGVFQGWKEA